MPSVLGPLLSCVRKSVGVFLENVLVRSSCTEELSVNVWIVDSVLL